jgi:hypothetical protein
MDVRRNSGARSGGRTVHRWPRRWVARDATAGDACPACRCTGPPSFGALHRVKHVPIRDNSRREQDFEFGGRRTSAIVTPAPSDGSRPTTPHQRQTRRHCLRVSRNGRYWIRTPGWTSRVSRGKEERGAETDARAGVRAAVKAGRVCRGEDPSPPGEGHSGQRGGLPREGRRSGGRASWAATGPPRRREHALGPTEEQAGATEFVSTGCPRCHRYRNLQLWVMMARAVAHHRGLPLQVSPIPQWHGLGIRFWYR